MTSPFDLIQGIPLDHVGPVAAATAAYATVLGGLTVGRLIFSKSETIAHAHSAACLPIKLLAGVSWLPFAAIGEYAVPDFVNRAIDKVITKKRILGIMDFWFSKTKKRVEQGTVTDTADYIIAGGEDNLKNFAEKEFPKAKFNYLYQLIPEDVRRNIVMDGRLPGGRRVTWRAWRHVRLSVLQAIARDAAKIGVKAGVIWTVALLTLAYLTGSAQAPVPYPGWAVGLDSMVVYQWYLACAITSVTGLVGTLGTAMGTGVLFGTAMGISSLSSKLNDWHKQAGAALATATRDHFVHWGHYAATREIRKEVYNRQIFYVNEWLKGQPFAAFAKTTGLLQRKGVWGCNPGVEIGCDLEGMLRHFLILGSSGSMKTFLAFCKIIIKILKSFTESGKQIGGFFTDGKSTLPHEFKARLLKEMESENLPYFEISTIGIKEGEQGCNLFGGFSALDVQESWENANEVISRGTPPDAFFGPSAKEHVLHVANIAETLQYDPEMENDLDLWEAYVPLSISGMRALIGNSNTLKLAIARVSELQRTALDIYPDATKLHEKLQSDDLKVSLDYFGPGGEWTEMADKTKPGILKQANLVFGTLASSGELTKRFSTGRYHDNCDVIDIPDRHLVFENIPEGTVAGTIIKVLLQKRFETAKNRQQANDPEKCKRMTTILGCDECHFTMGKSNAKWVSRARSAGVISIWCTQSEKALYDALGKDGVNALLNNIQNNVFFSMDEPDTIEHIIKKEGEMLAGICVSEELKYETQAAREAEIPDVFTPYMSDPGFKLRYLKIPSPDLNTLQINMAANYDEQFIPGDTGTNASEVISAHERAHNRAEDKAEARLGQGVGDKPVITSADLRRGVGFAYGCFIRGNIAMSDIIDMGEDVFKRAA